MVVRSPGSRPSQIAPDRPSEHFTGTCFRQLRHKPDVCRTAKVANLVVHQRHNRLLFRMCDVAIFKAVALFRNNKRDRYLPFQRVLHADYRHFGNVRIAGNTLLDLARPQPVPCHVYHVIRTPQNEVIAVSVTNAPVKGGVHRRENSDQ